MPPGSATPAGLGERPLGRATSRALTAVMVLAALAFVAVTIGTSLIGRTSFYAGGILVNNQPWLGAGHGPVELTNNFAGDTIDTVTPSRAQIVDRVRDGDWPGWTSLQGGGAELASVPSYGLLAPTATAWWVLPHDLASAWEKLTVLVVAAAGTALFLRRLGAGRHSAWLAGMVYAASGFMIAWTNWPQAGVAAMVPWLFWATERALQLRTMRAQVPVALSVTALLFGGFPAVTGLALYVAGGFVLVRLATRAVGPEGRWRAGLADIGRLVTGLLTGVLLACVQLVVFAYDFASMDTSHRAVGFFREQPLKMALTSLFPNAWGTLGGGPFSINPIESNAYLGVAAAVLIAVALVLRPGPRTPRGVRTYFAAVLLVGFLLIYAQSPLTNWLGVLPVFSGNAIGRLLSVLMLVGATLAGLGFDHVLSGTAAHSRAARLRLAAGLAAAVAVIGGLAVWVYRVTAGQLDAATEARLLGIAVVGAVLTAAALTVASLRPSWRGAALAVVPVVVVAQGASAAIPMWAQVDRDDFYPTTAAHEFLADAIGDDRMAVAGPAMVNGSTAYYGLRSATGHVFTAAELAELQDAVCTDCQATATYWVLPGTTEPTLWQSPVLDRMGVRYLTIDPEAEVPGVQEEVTGGDEVLPVPTADQPPMAVTVPAGPLRAVTLDFRGGPSEITAGELVVEVRDATGEVLASVHRRLGFPRPGGPLTVPLAGESLPADGDLTVEVHYEGDTTAPVVSGTPDGVPRLTVVRPTDDGLRLAYAEDVTIWERTSALPRIRWAGSAEVVEDADDRLAALASGAVPADTVLLDTPGQPTDGAPADVTVLSGGGDEVRVRVDAQGDGHLVLADSVQRDWTATVDGEEVPIVAADHAFGAVHVTEGVHEVTFEYTPRGATAGLTLTGVGLLALALMALPPSTWRRRRPGGEAEEADLPVTQPDDTMPMSRSRAGAPR